MRVWTKVRTRLRTKIRIRVGGRVRVRIRVRVRVRVRVILRWNYIRHLAPVATVHAFSSVQLPTRECSPLSRQAM